MLQSGWCYASTLLDGGARQILRIHHPGDVVNVSCLAWSRVAATVTAATEAEVSPFPRKALADIFSHHPRLAALLFGISTVENVALSDRLKSLGRTDGRARIATLLLELLSRQQLTDGERPNTLDLFLSQAEIARCGRADQGACQSIAQGNDREWPDQARWPPRGSASYGDAGADQRLRRPSCRVGHGLVSTAGRTFGGIAGRPGTPPCVSAAVTGSGSSARHRRSGPTRRATPASSTRLDMALKAAWAAPV